jgi:5'-3' exonuclease
LKLLIDGNNILFAAVGITLIDNDNCEDKNLQLLVVNNFFIKINSIIKNFDIKDIIFCWDSRTGSSYRKNIYPFYKMNRKFSLLKEILFKEIFPKIKEGLNYYPILQIEHEKAEGDDIIYSLCCLYKDEEIIIMSSDSDLKQILLLFNNVKQYNHIKKEFYEKPSEDFLKEKAIVGDHNNVKGIRGIGKKTYPLYLNGIKQLNEEQLLEFNKILEVIDLNKYFFKDIIFEDIKKIINNFKIEFKANELEYFFFINKLDKLYDKFFIIKGIIINQLEGGL